MAKNYYFTFGVGTIHKNKYARFEAENELAAREEMCQKYGTGWCACYTEEKFKGQPEKYGWVEIQDNVKAGLQFQVCDILQARFENLFADLGSSYSRRMAERLSEKVTDRVYKEMGYDKNPNQSLCKFEVIYALGKELGELLGIEEE